MFSALTYFIFTAVIQSDFLPPLHGLPSSQPCQVTYTASVLGRDKVYTVKYTPSAEGGGVYLTVYPELSPNTNII